MDLIKTLVVDMSAPFSAMVVLCLLGFFAWSIVRRIMRMTEEDREESREQRRINVARQIRSQAD